MKHAFWRNDPTNLRWQSAVAAQRRMYCASVCGCSISDRVFDPQQMAMTHAKCLTPTVKHTFFSLSFFIFQSLFHILTFLLIPPRIIIIILVPMLHPIHVPWLLTPFIKNHLLVCSSPAWISTGSGLSFQFGNPHIPRLFIVFLSHSRLMLVYFLKMWSRGFPHRVSHPPTPFYHRRCGLQSEILSVPLHKPGTKSVLYLLSFIH